MSTTPEAKRLLAAFLTKFPSLDPQWSEEVRGAWMRCFAALQLLCAPQPPAGEGQEPVAGWDTGLGLAVIGRRHFGNPIPQQWYEAARELLDKVASPARAPTDYR